MYWKTCCGYIRILRWCHSNFSISFSIKISVIFINFWQYLSCFFEPSFRWKKFCNMATLLFFPFSYFFFFLRGTTFSSLSWQVNCIAPLSRFLCGFFICWTTTIGFQLKFWVLYWQQLIWFSRENPFWKQPLLGKQLHLNWCKARWVLLKCYMYQSMLITVFPPLITALK